MDAQGGHEMTKQTTEPMRFLDMGKTIYDFGDRFLVRCPRCAHCAIAAPSQPSDSAHDQLFAPHRLVCAACGLAREWDGKRKARWPHEGKGRPVSILIGEPVDWYFRLPLWLQAPCCGATLWAYNAEHLAFLRGFVTAQLRERLASASTRSAASRLPHWMITAKNRDEVTRGLERLERLLVAE